MRGICYIIGACETSCKVRKKPGDIVIAADAGFLSADGRLADIVVGDFDSLGYVPQERDVIIHPVRKDDTDTMLAVKTGFERGYSRFVITGGIGGRLDHTLANIQTLAYIAERGGRGCMCGDCENVIVIKNGTVSFNASCKGFISVFALGDEAKGVYLRGLSYPLENATVTPDFPIGVSNAFTGVPSFVTVENGSLAVIFTGDIAACNYLSLSVGNGD